MQESRPKMIFKRKLFIKATLKSTTPLVKLALYIKAVVWESMKRESMRR